MAKNLLHPAASHVFRSVAICSLSFGSKTGDEAASPLANGGCSQDPAAPVPTETAALSPTTSAVQAGWVCVGIGAVDRLVLPVGSRLFQHRHHSGHRGDGDPPDAQWFPVARRRAGEHRSLRGPFRLRRGDAGGGCAFHAADEGSAGRRRLSMPPISTTRLASPAVNTSQTRGRAGGVRPGSGRRVV